jgi:hypothetical protein
MRAKRFYSLLFLTLALMLGEACATSRPHTGPDAGGDAQANPGILGPRDYSAPDNTFTVKIPGGWKLQREEKDGAFLTVILPAQTRPANLSIVTINSSFERTDSAERKSHILVEVSKPFFQGWINGLKEQARVEGTGNIYPTRFADFEALRMDVTYYRDDADDPRQGYSLFLIGDKTTFFIYLTGSKPQFKELEQIISTIRLEP